MVRTTAPLFSLSAAGSIARTLSYARGRSGSFIRFRTMPEDPRTQKQLAYRSAMRMLSLGWRNLQPGNQATWNNEPIALQLTPYHAYCAHNLDIFRENQPLNQRPTSWYVAGNPTYGTATAVANDGLVTIQLPNVVRNNSWGMYLWRHTSTPIPRDMDHLVAIILLDVDRTYTVFDAPPLGDTYWYRFRPFRYSANWSPLSARPQVTI